MCDLLPSEVFNLPCSESPEVYSVVYQFYAFHCSSDVPPLLLLPMIDAYVPPQLFYNSKVDYFDLQRLGGLLSHLKKTLKGLEDKLDFLPSRCILVVEKYFSEEKRKIHWGTSSIF